MKLTHLILRSHNLSLYEAFEMSLFSESRISDRWVNLSNPGSIKKPQLINIINKTMKCITINYLKNKNKNKKGDFPMVWAYMPLTKSKLCFGRIKFFGRLNFVYFDTIRDIKSSEIVNKKSQFFWFENCSEFLKIVNWTCFCFIRFGLVLAVHEDNFRTSLTKTIYTINMCKSQYKKNLKKKTWTVNGGLFLDG